MKKLASLLLVLFMLSLIPAFAFADSDITVSGTGRYWSRRIPPWYPSGSLLRIPMSLRQWPA